MTSLMCISGLAKKQFGYGVNFLGLIPYANEIMRLFVVT